jgi:hypothetical protein
MSATAGTVGTTLQGLSIPRIVDSMSLITLAKVLLSKARWRMNQNSGDSMTRSKSIRSDNGCQFSARGLALLFLGMELLLKMSSDLAFNSMEELRSLKVGRHINRGKCGPSAAYTPFPSSR